METNDNPDLPPIEPIQSKDDSETPIQRTEKAYKKIYKEFLEDAAKGRFTLNLVEKYIEACSLLERDPKVSFKEIFTILLNIWEKQARSGTINTEGMRNYITVSKQVDIPVDQEKLGEIKRIAELAKLQTVNQQEDKAFDAQSSNSFEKTKLYLSPSVINAGDQFPKGETISAAAIVRGILQNHSEYADGKVTVLQLEETELKHPASAWIDEVQALFDPSRMQELSKSNETPVLHGRLAIVGLSLLEPQLRSQLEVDGIFDALVNEIEEPIKEILTERGRKLLESPAGDPADSVPNQPDDPLRLLEQDQLGRAAFAQYLAKRILAIPEDSGAYSIHVYGPWGSGKSTMLNFIRSELEKEGGWLVTEFNAWRHQYIQPPWWSLLESVFQQTRQKLSFRQRLREYWWRFSSGRIHYFIALIVLIWLVVLIVFPLLRKTTTNPSTLGDLATAADSIGKILAVVITIWGIIAAFSRSLLLGASKAAQSYMELTHDSMNEIKKRFKTLIKRLDPNKVVVFIDDLDRCQSKYVVDLLEGIQTLFREAPVVFIVASDRKWLNACYEEIYDKLKPWVREPGKPLGVLFLEKAFQFSASIPGIPIELREAYWKNLIQVKPSETEKELAEGRKQAKEMMAGAGTDGDVVRLVIGSREKSFQEQRAIREEAVIRLATPEIVERTEHALLPFVSYLKPNPRAMKGLVNAYSVNRAIATLSHIDVERDRLVLWTILSIRWPLLAEYLEKNPKKIGNILQRKLTDLTKDQEGLKDLVNDKDVLSVLEGGSTGVPLNSDIVRQCALLRG